ncbi:MAG: hypothetical protein L0338_15895, partial [Acidobacteria bacterium]|nr:hypothetical protein [Acidobacteriota bacterium]
STGTDAAKEGKETAENASKNNSWYVILFFLPFKFAFNSLDLLLQGRNSEWQNKNKERRGAAP